MPSFDGNPNGCDCGCVSLLGGERKSLLEEASSRDGICDWWMRKWPREQLTEAGGEPAVILRWKKGASRRRQIVFFAGSSDFTLANFEMAHRSGAAS